MSPRATAVLVALVVALLVPALLLTGIRLGDPRTGLLIQLGAFTPFALAPYLLAALIGGVALLRGSGPRTLLAVPVVVAAAGLVVHLAWVAPLVTGGQRAPVPGAEPVVLMSSNVFFGRGDGAAVVREATEADVDVLVLSEVTVDTVAAMEAAGVDERFPHRVGAPGATESNVGTMVWSRTPVTLEEDLAGTTFDNLVVRTAGLRLVAAHPAAPLDPEEWREDHARILEAVRQRRPDVVVGDLNATLDHRPVRRLLDAGYRDAAELTNAGLQPTWPANGKYPVLGRFPPSAPIDHVLVGQAWTATGTGRVVVPDSDHLAVLSSLAPAAG